MTQPIGDGRAGPATKPAGDRRPLASGPPVPVANAVNPVVVTPWHHLRFVRITLAVVAVVAILIGATAMLLILGKNFGIGVLTLAAGAAIIPVPFLVLALMWLDRYEPEPLHYLAFAFFWGAFGATAIALMINTAGLAVLAGPTSNHAEHLTSIIVAPPTEETAKAIPLFIFMILAIVGRRPINGIIDGIVYAGMAAVGFAFVENILYFGEAYAAGRANGNGSSGLFTLLAAFILRGVMSPFAHPLFTCMTGIGVGLAVRHKQRSVQILGPILGWSLAVALHALWNILATSGNLWWLGLGYLFVMLPLFAAVVSLAVWLRSREAKLSGQILPPYVAAGWLTHNELAAMSSIKGRRAARNWARGVGGAPAAKAMQEFQLAATRLALLREAMLDGRAARDYALQEQGLLSYMAVRRHVFTVSAAESARRWTQHAAYYQHSWVVY